MERQRYSKREFLTISAEAASLVLLGSLFLDTSQVKTPEQQQNAGKTTTFIDVSPRFQVLLANQKHFPSPHKVRKLLGDEYVSRASLFSKLGPRVLRADYQTASKVVQEFGLPGLFASFYYGYEYHSHKVLKSYRSLLGSVGLSSRPLLEPLQSAFLPENLNLNYLDVLDNHGFELFVPADPVISQLAQLPPQENVNISFELGLLKVLATYRQYLINYSKVYEYLPNVARNYHRYGEIEPEKEKSVFHESLELREFNQPTMMIVPAYGKESVRQSLKELFKLCHAFPDTLFVCAAGNYGDDLRFARHDPELIAIWPPNVLLVAEWHPDGHPQTFVFSTYGADIYINNRSFGLPEGSSFSTATVTGLVDMKKTQGVHGVLEMKNEVLGLCKQRPYTPLLKQRYIMNPDEFYQDLEDHYALPEEEMASVIERQVG